MDLGKVGIWWSRSWGIRDEVGLDAGTEIESLGYGAIWSLGDSVPGFPSIFSDCSLPPATSPSQVAS